MKDDKVNPVLTPFETVPPPTTEMFRGQQILRAPVNVATPTTVAELVTVLRTLGLLK